MLYEGNICYVRDKLIEEIKHGCISQLRDDITTEEFINDTKIILDLLSELEEKIQELDSKALDFKIEIYENPMGSLYYEEVKEED